MARRFGTRYRLGYPITIPPRDTTGPTVVLTTEATDPVGDSFSVTATFNEPVIGFIVSDITVTNGSAGSFVAVSDSVYTVTITPAAYGTVTVAIAAGVCTDLAGNANTASNTLIREYAYWKRVLALSPIQLLRLNEESGATAADSSGNGYDSTYAGVTLATLTGPDGNYAGLFDGINDYVDCDSSGVAAPFDGAEGTALIWFRVSGAGVWSDGVTRAVFDFYSDDSNRFSLRKFGANGYFYMERIAGGTSKYLQKASPSDTDWVCLALTWSESDDELIAYWDGVSLGTETSIGTWSGALTRLRIGAVSTNLYWDGGLALPTLWDTALTPVQIASLSVV
jgi:hypothetical protein